MDSPILSPEKERTGRVASLQVTERDVECEFEFEFVSDLMGNLKLEVEGLERKIEEEKKERDVEVGVAVDSAAILSSVGKAFHSSITLLRFFYPILSNHWCRVVRTFLHSMSFFFNLKNTQKQLYYRQNIS